MEVTFWINAHKANAAGKVPVSMRLTVAGQRTEISTGIRCQPAQWDKATKRLRPAGRRDVATLRLNTLLDELEAEARLSGADLRRVASAEQPLTAAALRAKLLPPPPPPVVEALAALRAAAELLPNAFTRAAYVTAVNTLQRFRAPAPTLPLPELTPELVAAFVAWLAARPGGRAGGHYLAQLRALYGRTWPKLPNPFAGAPARLPAAPAKPRYVLSRAEFAALRVLPLPAGSREAVARDIYLTQYYLHGSRIGVMLELTWGQVNWAAGRVRYLAEKGGSWHDVALRPALAEVLRAYYPGPGATGFVFPVLPADYPTAEPGRRFKARKQGNTYVWRGLQRVGELLGLPGKLHPHTARHTLATHSVQATKSFRVAKELLGHQSIAVTEKYVRAMLPEELDSVADSVYTG